MATPQIDDGGGLTEGDSGSITISAVEVEGQAGSSPENTRTLSQDVGNYNNTKRLSRNICEKIRRDRLKSHIHQLASKLPVIATCGKKLDKCTILRLTVAFLKMHTGLKKMKLEIEGWCPTFLSKDNLGNTLHQTLDGFFLVVSQSGTIVYASDKITSLLGHSQLNLLGKSFFHLLHEDDQELFKAQFQSTSTNCTDKNGQHSYCSLYLRMLNLNIIDCLKSVYSVVHLVGNIQRFSLLERSRRPDNLNEKWLVAICRLQVPRCTQEISLIDYQKAEWISQHKMNGEMFYLDSRVSCLTGYLPSEQIGFTPYSFLHEDDLEAVGNSHMKIMKEDLIPQTIFRLKTVNGNYLFIQSSSCVARDQWTKQAKFIVSLNQVLEKEEGERKLAVQKQELDLQKLEKSKMFTDDILTIMSDALTGNVTPLQDEVQCENMDWGCAQFMTPMGNVMRSSVTQPQQAENRPSATSNCASSTSNCASASSNCTSAIAISPSATSSRKRPADDQFVKLIQASIMPYEDMDVSPPKCPQLSPVCTKSTSDCSPCSALCSLSSEDNLSVRPECKACCSSNKHSGSMLKSLLTDEHAKHPGCTVSASRVLSPPSCPQSPRTPGSKSNPDSCIAPSPRTEKDNNQADAVLELSCTPMSVKSSSSDQNVVSPGSPATLQTSFVVNFTEQLKQKHALMEQSLLLQENTIYVLESEVKKVKSTGHSSPHFQKICERLHAIKASKAKQQAELQCLQNKLNLNKSSSPASSTQSSPNPNPTPNHQMSADIPSSTLAQMVFPGSESVQSTAQIDLGEIEPTFYPTVSTENSKTTPSYNFLKKNISQSPSQTFSQASTIVRLPSHNNTHLSQGMSQSSLGSLSQPSYTFTQSPGNNGPFSSVGASQISQGHVPLRENVNQSVSHTGVRNQFSSSASHASQQQYQAFPIPCMGYQSGFGSGAAAGHCGMGMRSNQTSGSGPVSSTQPHYTHQMPLTSPAVNNMSRHGSMSSRIIDRDQVKSRNDRIKIITTAYTKLPQPACHPSACTTVPSVQSQNSLFTM